MSIKQAIALITSGVSEPDVILKRLNITHEELRKHYSDYAASPGLKEEIKSYAIHNPDVAHKAIARKFKVTTLFVQNVLYRDTDPENANYKAYMARQKGVEEHLVRQLIPNLRLSPKAIAGILEDVNTMTRPAVAAKWAVSEARISQLITKYTNRATIPKKRIAPHIQAEIASRVAAGEDPKALAKKYKTTVNTVYVYARKYN